MTLNDTWLAQYRTEHPDSVNPMETKHGSGPAGTTCAGCRGLINADGVRADTARFRCRHRMDRKGQLPGSHQPFWPTCKRFDPLTP